MSLLTAFELNHLIPDVDNSLVNRLSKQQEDDESYFKDLKVLAIQLRSLLNFKFKLEQ